MIMAIYTERLQTVLTREQYETLLRLSEKTQKPLSVLVREAIEKVYIDSEEREQRRQALDELLSLEAPVADWEEMEAEIIAGATT
jgi:predicted DNA-binding protein